MRTIPMAAAAVLVIASGMASAQTTSPRPPGAPTPGAATAPAPRPTPNPLKQEDVSQLDGTGVYGGDNGKVGHVSTVLMNPESKQIDRLVVTSGGVLGVGGHRVAIPIDQFAWDAEKGAFRLPMTTANLKAMPEWAEGAEPASGSSTPPRAATPPAGARDSEK